MPFHHPHTKRRRSGMNAALVRLKWCVVGVVKVRSLAVTNREATDCNCAGATRGGEQRKVNGQSVTNVSLGRETT